MVFASPNAERLKCLLVYRLAAEQLRASRGSLRRRCDQRNLTFEVKLSILDLPFAVFLDQLILPAEQVVSVALNRTL